MPSSRVPEDTIYVDEMECVPINELGEKIDYNNEESTKDRFFWKRRK